MLEWMQTGNEGSGERRMSPDRDARGEALKYAIAPNPRDVCFLLPRGRGTVGEAGGLRLFWYEASGSLSDVDELSGVADDANSSGAASYGGTGEATVTVGRGSPRCSERRSKGRRC